MDIMLAGEDQPQADQLNSLAEGPPVVGMELSCELGSPLRGTGSIDSPTHTQKDCVESDLSTLKLFCTVVCVVAVRYGGFGCSIHEVTWLELYCFLQGLQGKKGLKSIRLTASLPGAHKYTVFINTHEVMKKKSAATPSLRLILQSARCEGASSDKDSIRVAEGASSLIRNA
eukprot:1161838-Pelagomonas_calceolata.AAC.10